MNEKVEIIESYDGETKHELLTLIRERFPLSSSDRRRGNIAESTINSLERVCATLRNNRVAMTKSQKETLLSLLNSIQSLVKDCPKG